MFPSLTMPVLRELPKPHVMCKNSILILLIASCFAQSLAAVEATGHDFHAHSTGGEDRSPICEVINEPSQCDLEDLPASCTELPKCVIPNRAGIRPTYTAGLPWDTYYMNLYTPMPDGGLVVSEDEMHVDLRITSPNQTCKWILRFMKRIRVLLRILIAPLDLIL